MTTSDKSQQGNDDKNKQRTHTPEEIAKIERETGQKLSGWVHIGDTSHPVFVIPNKRRSKR